MIYTEILLSSSRNRQFRAWLTILLCSVFTLTATAQNNNVVIPPTSLSPQDCGRANLTTADSIQCDTVSGATGYIFNVTHAPSAFAASVPTTGPVLLLADVPGLQAQLIYEVRVQPVVSNLPGANGPPCTIALLWDSITTCQAPIELRAGGIYSTMINVRFTDAVLGASPPSESSGLSAITDPDLLNLLNQTAAQAGFSADDFRWVDWQLDHVLPQPDMKHIFELHCPVAVDMVALGSQLETLPVVDATLRAIATETMGNVPYTDIGKPGEPYWYIDQLQAPGSWVFMHGLPEISVSILEPGRTDGSHPEMVGNVVNYNPSWPTASLHHHALEVGAMIAAEPNTNNTYIQSGNISYTAGITGVTHGLTRLYSDTQGGLGPSNDWFNSVGEPGPHPPRVLNCSFGYVDWDWQTSTKIFAKRNSIIESTYINIQNTYGTLIFASTGNSCHIPFGLTVARDARGYIAPAAIPGVIGVGATRKTPSTESARAGGAGPSPYASNPAWNYNLNDPADPYDDEGYLDITAPGVDILTAYNANSNVFVGHNIHRVRGTSLASPMVAATAGALLRVNPNLTRQEVLDILLATTDKVRYHPQGNSFNEVYGSNWANKGYRYDNGGDFTHPNLDWQMGHGRLNMLSAVMNAAGLTGTADGFVVSPALGEHCVTVHDINKHQYLDTLAPGSYNAGWAYDAILNQNGSVVTFDGNTAMFELDTNATFRVEAGASLQLRNGADLLLQPGDGGLTRLEIGNGGTVRMDADPVALPSDALILVENGGHLVLEDGQTLTIGAGASLIVRNGGTIELNGSAQLIIEDNATVCIEEGAAVDIEAASTIDVLATALQGYPAALNIAPGTCMCPYDFSPGIGTVNVFFPVVSVATTATTNAGCDCSGSATVAASGGAPGSTYSYLWDDPNDQTGPTASGLCAGDVDVTATDDWGCTGTTTVTLTGGALTTTLVASNDVSCNGLSDGSASIAVTGGSAPYTYTWSNGASGPIVSGLPAGVYQIDITDAGGVNCAAIQVAIGGPDVLTATTSGSDVSCGGAADGSMTVAPAGGTAPYTYQWNDVLAQTTASATGLGLGLNNGSYTVTVTDANSCTVVATHTITEPTPLSAAVTVWDATCNNTWDGNAVADVSGGQPPYYYNWNVLPVSYSPTTHDTLWNRKPGTYTVNIADSTGCSIIATAVIGEAFPVSGTFTTTAASCGNCDGAATVAPVNGTAPFTYLWDANTGAQTGATASALCPGNYEVEVTDSLGCTGTATTVVAGGNGINLTVNATPNPCHGDSIAQLAAVVTGGVPPYTYLWDDPMNQTSATATGLKDGTYGLTVTDATACQLTYAYQLDDPNPWSGFWTKTNVSCNGGANGTLKRSSPGGTAPFTFLWSNGQTTNLITGLVAGTYTQTITDANGCPRDWSSTITEPAPLVVSTAPACSGTASALTATATGGTAPYGYLWGPPLYQTTATATGLTPGSYPVTVTDDNQCTAFTTATVSGSGVLSVTVNSADMSCNNVADGSVSTSVTGGSAPYSYAWSNGATTSGISGLSQGNYQCTITDNAGNCEIVGAFISNPIPLLVLTGINTGSCNSLPTGFASAYGGVAPYSYAWNTTPVQNNDSAFGLQAGTYTVVVTDAAGCTVTDSVVANPNGFSVVIAEIVPLCAGPATIEAVPSGPSGWPYTYQWSNGATTDTISGLTAGTYTVTVTVGPCVEVASITLNSGSAITLGEGAQAVSCNGSSDGSAWIIPSGGTQPYTYQWSANAGFATTDTVTGLPTGAYLVTVTDANGCSATEAVGVSFPPPINYSLTPTSPVCPGGTDGGIDLAISGGYASFSYSWSNGATTQDLSGIPAGTYTITAVDTGGCVVTDSVAVNAPAAMVLTPTMTPATCYGGTDGAISLSVTGGTAPYAYQWSAISDTTANPTGLQAGWYYNAIVTDANGCIAQLAPNTVQIGQGAQVQASITSSTDTYCADADAGSATASGSNGTAPYSYLWGGNSGNQTTATATGLGTGSHNVTVTDANGCTAQNTAVVTVSLTNPAGMSINTNTAWSGMDLQFGADVVINTGATLSILNGSTIRFAEDAGIIVQPGAMLYVVGGSQLTNLEGCSEMWDGVLALADTNIFLGGSPNSGYSVVSMNGATVKNAHIGINSITPIYQPQMDPNDAVIPFRGGTFIINNTAFRNCRIGLQAGWGGYAGSSINSGYFIADAPLEDVAEYNGEGTEIMVKLIASQGVPMTNCQFTSTFAVNQLSGEDRTGVDALAANYSLISNDFTGLKRGIASFGNLGNIGNEIRQNTFDDVEYGAYLQAHELDVIEQNDFVNIPGVGTDGETYGIMYVSGAEFEMRENLFSSVSTPAGFNAGIIFDGVWYDGGVAFKNDFENSRAGISSQDDNYFLKIRCNNFASNGQPHVDAGIIVQDGTNNPGALMDQGLPCDGNSFNRAGNAWGDACTGSDETDIKVEDQIPFNYYSHTDASYEPECSTDDWATNHLFTCTQVNANSCDNAWQGLIGFGGNLPSYANAVYNKVTDHKGTIDVLSEYIDKGDTQGLLDEIDRDLSESNLLKLLSTAHPYVSDEVLIAAITDKPTPLSGVGVVAIVKANAPVSDAVMNAILNRVPPLSQGELNQIAAGQKGMSERLRLERQMDALTAEIWLLESELLRQYDKVGDVSGAEGVLHRSNSVSAKKLLADRKYWAGTYVSARMMLDSVIVLDTLGKEVTNITEESAKYYALMNTMIDIGESGRTLWEMNSAEETTIRAVAASHTRIAARAEAILDLTKSERVYHKVLVPSANAKRGTDLLEDQEPQLYSGSRALSVYPNPNSGQLTVSVNNTYEQPVRFRIFDMTGRTRLDVPLPAPTEIIGHSLEPGVYVYRAEADGNVIGTARLVVIH